MIEKNDRRLKELKRKRNYKKKEEFRARANENNEFYD